MVNDLVLRSQAQAQYSPENLGHFGLALRRYAHFTSPIRRYSDVLVHRGLIKALALGDDGLADAEAARMRQLGEHISMTERRAQVAERDAIDRYTALYLSSQVGGDFAGRISGVSRFGLFIALDDTGADGLIPISTLGADFFEHDERHHRLVGRKTRISYQLGQPVHVRLADADPVKGGLVFQLLQAERSDGRPERPLKPRREGPRRKPDRRRRG
jgi:ribonuclease R